MHIVVLRRPPPSRQKRAMRTICVQHPAMSLLQLPDRKTCVFRGSVNTVHGENAVANGVIQLRLNGKQSRFIRLTLSVAAGSEASYRQSLISHQPLFTRLRVQTFSSSHRRVVPTRGHRLSIRGSGRSRQGPPGARQVGPTGSKRAGSEGHPGL